MLCFFFQAEDGIRDIGVTGVQTCALPIFFADLLKKIKAHRPGLHIKGFTAVELDYMFRKAKMSVPDGMAFFKSAGLESRSEERRVGEECRSRGSPYHLKKKKNMYPMSDSY